MPTLLEIRKKFQKEIKESSALIEDDLPEIHVAFMMELGYISLEEFKKIPLPTFWNIYSILCKKWKREKEDYDKMMEKKK